MRKHVLYQAILLALGGAMLAGCGSGGSSSSPDQNVSSGTVEGVAAKGIIRYGTVTAEELGANGMPLREVGTADTNEKGEFSLKLSDKYQGGPLLLTIKAKPGNATTMKCDIQDGCGNNVAYGGEMPLDGSFSLQAVRPAVKPGATVNAQITPFSNMAAARVKAELAAKRSADIETTINEIISEVNQIVGVNILETEPIDITNPEEIKNATDEELTYAVFNAAAGSIALQYGKDKDLGDGLQKLAESFNDGELDSDDILSPTNLRQEVEDNLESIKSRSDAVIAINNQIDAIVTSTKDGTYNPEPIPTSTLTAVEQAKQLVGQARTLGNSIASLEDPAEAFKADIDVAAQVIDNESKVLVTLTGTIIEQVFNALMAQHPIPLGTQTVSIKDSAGNSVGNATVTLADNNGLNISISAPSIKSASINLTLSSNAPASLLNGTPAQLSDANFTISGAAESAKARLTLTDMRLNAVFAQPVTVDPNATTPPEPVVKSLDINSASGAIKLEDLEHAVSFTGAANFNLVALNASAARNLIGAPTPLSLAKADLSGTFAGNGNSFTASAKLDVNNAASFDTFAYLDYEPQMWVEYSIDGDALKASSYAANLGISSLNSAWSWFSTSEGTVETCFTGTGQEDAYGKKYVQQECVSGDVLKTKEAFTVELKKRNPNIATLYPDMQISWFGFSYDSSTLDYQTGASKTPTTWLYGELDLGSFESASYFAKGSLSVNLDLALRGYPNTSAIITANRTELKGGDALVTLLHNGSTVTLKLVKTGTNPKPDGTLTVSNPDGVKLVVTAKDGVTRGNVTLADGTLVGTVEKSDNGLYIIRYKDGTFETLQ